jgi:hypothetical protein
MTADLFANLVIVDVLQFGTFAQLGAEALPRGCEILGGPALWTDRDLDLRPRREWDAGHVDLATIFHRCRCLVRFHGDCLIFVNAYPLFPFTPVSATFIAGRQACTSWVFKFSNAFGWFPNSHCSRPEVSSGFEEETFGRPRGTIGRLCHSA